MFVQNTTSSITLLRRGSSDLQTRENWKEPLLYNTGVMVPVSFRDYSSVTQHIVDLQEDAEEDSKCTVQIFRPEPSPPPPPPPSELRGLSSNHYLKKATCGPNLTCYVAGFLLSSLEVLRRRVQRFSFSLIRWKRILKLRGR